MDLGSGCTLADIGEFALIDALRAVAADPTGFDQVLVGPGDDTAVISCPSGQVVITTDMLVEGTHFRRDWSSAFDVGRKSAATSLADIAAMGAVPTALVVAFAAPGDLSVAWAVECMRGLGQEAGALGAAIVGGDVVSAGTITISVTAIGETRGRPPVLRSGARAGDVLALAGRVGWSAAGLEVLTRGSTETCSPIAEQVIAAQVIAAHRCPEPPYADGPAAAVAGASAMIDISDGLISEARHLANSSQVVIEISTTDWEVPQTLLDAGLQLGLDPMVWMLTGGEDHGLLATFPPEARIPPDFRVIGCVTEITDSGAGVRVDGRWAPAKGGFDHFG